MGRKREQSGKETRGEQSSGGDKWKQTDSSGYRRDGGEESGRV